MLLRITLRGWGAAFQFGTPEPFRAPPTTNVLARGPVPAKFPLRQYLVILLLLGSSAAREGFRALLCSGKVTLKHTSCTAAAGKRHRAATQQKIAWGIMPSAKAGGAAHSEGTKRNLSSWGHLAGGISRRSIPEEPGSSHLPVCDLIETAGE